MLRKIFKIAGPFLKKWMKLWKMGGGMSRDPNDWAIHQAQNAALHLDFMHVKCPPRVQSPRPVGLRNREHLPQCQEGPVSP